MDRGARVPQSRDCGGSAAADNSTAAATAMIPSSNRRLQLATRIHYALLRELGLGIEIGRLLKHPLYARDVLLVCDACEGNELPRLARALRGAMQEAVEAGATGTSSFGMSAFSASQLSIPGEDQPESVPAA
jgi:hypothetical protein